MGFTHQQLVVVLVIQYRHIVPVMKITVIQLPEELVTQRFPHILTDKQLVVVIEIQQVEITQLLVEVSEIHQVDIIHLLVVGY